MKEDDTKSKIEKSYKALAFKELEENVKDMAKLLYEYRKSLLYEGFSHEESILLTVEFQKTLLNLGKK